jgi:two-component system chemotaxis response regulator CheY
VKNAKKLRKRQYLMSGFLIYDVNSSIFTIACQKMSKTILIVDDSASLRQVVRMALQAAGHTVLEAGDGKAALAMLDGRNVDIAVCDINMPIMNGIEFLKAVKALPAYKFMPVLMLTTESSDKHKEAGKAAGAKAWMTKPFIPSQLVNAVNKLCP